MNSPCMKCKDRKGACQDYCIKKMAYDLEKLDYCNEYDSDREYLDYIHNRKTPTRPPASFRPKNKNF